MKVTFACSASGRSYFEKFIQDLPTQDRADILAVFQGIQEDGFNAKGCEYRQIEGKLWEIKIRAPSGGYRFFYLAFTSDHIHVLHSYKKQGQKAPVRELNLAKKRMKETIDGN